jgi:hypothetical protein
MKKLAVVAAGLGVLALAVGPAIAGGNGAQKATLFPAGSKPPGGHCDKMQMGMTDQGFVVFNLPGQPGTGNGTVIVQTSLKGGTANAAYDIYLQKNGSGCTKLANPVSTNVQGNGNAHNTTPGGPGTYQVFLENQAKSSNSYISVPVVSLN